MNSDPRPGRFETPSRMGPGTGSLPASSRRVEQPTEAMSGHANRIVVMVQQGRLIDASFLDQLEHDLGVMEQETRQKLRGKSSLATVEGMIATETVAA